MIPFYLLPSASPTVSQIDDPATDTDLGASYTARLVTIQFAGTIWSMLRSLIQEVFVSTSGTMKVTPIADGSESAADAQTFTLVPGGNVVTAFLAKFGTRFQLAIEITAHAGVTELGDFYRRVIPRRTFR